MEITLSAENIDRLFLESKNEYNNPETIEFYGYEKFDKIVEMLSINLDFTIEYLTHASDEFFEFMFSESVDTAETILEKLNDKNLAKLILDRLCPLYEKSHDNILFDEIQDCKKFL